MPKRKKAADLTTDEALRKLFPKKVVDEIRKVAHESDDPAEKQQRNKPSS